jgi:hypothetical protein
VLAAAFVRRWRRGADLDAREIWLWLPAVAFFVYLSFFNTIHNGIRYLLPVAPLALVATGRLAAARRPAARAAVVALAAWVVGASLWIWPHYIAYHNELIGGPRNAFRYTSDSNLDWGQDLELLKAWMVESGVPRVGLAYFGSADPAHYGIDYDFLPSASSWLPRTPAGRPPAPVVALSAYQYQMVGFEQKRIYEAFHSLEPNARVGYSILVFDLERPLPRRYAQDRGAGASERR